ncbi:PREDICTED: somatomedin-B and thrombospondin type-1 domain-containing protein-like [Priapulus caudatus]|uniref:Somatomedin-B and thrombospondin type-1 domain-containing protein-like n=1 Tax=Priapulus caudatus TaxID=37621 RepID=A0ABM1EIQ9_PRICU|nr:PREDICTED: somatomedin-B and thrombospondin type-1 domain-containing protein-like [Priapulus caudatus]
MRLIASWLIVAVVVAVADVATSRGSCWQARMCCGGRNSTCVVQNYPVNSIPDDMDDEKCYCDEHCLTLGDCCQDYNRACRAKHCTVSPWSEWEECSTRCGIGMMKRLRNVTAEPSNGGDKCPHLKEMRGCMGFDCTHDERAAIKEMALLLPAKYAKARRYNPEKDIRRNLRDHYHKKNPIERKKYCLTFEIVRTHKYCNSTVNTWTHDLAVAGNKVCVECEPYAMTSMKGARCNGQGVAGVESRWKATNVPWCSGRWIQQELIEDCSCHKQNKNMPGYIFV